MRFNINHNSKSSGYRLVNDSVSIPVPVLIHPVARISHHKPDPDLICFYTPHPVDRPDHSGDEVDHRCHEHLDNDIEIELFQKINKTAKFEIVVMISITSTTM